MRIEHEKIRMLPFTIKSIPSPNADRIEIIELFQRSFSLQEVVQYFYSRGKLVSFCEILGLLDYLLKQKLIMNNEFYDYFNRHQASSKGFFDKLIDDLFYGETPVTEELDQIKKIPFFRSLSPEVLELFMQQASLLEVPAGITLCQEGARQRSLLVLLEGRAVAYKKEASAQSRKIVVLNESSVFGEAGFFFGEARTASVVAETPCRVMIIKYVPEVFEKMINIDKARRLQNRIWAIHALLKSEMFRDLPQKSFDELIFAGEFKVFPPKTLICRQGEIGSTCYVIVQGDVSVSQNSRFLQQLGQGDSFGELALMISAGQRTASVQSITEVLVLEIEKDRFYRMLSENLLLGCEFERLAKLRIKNAT